MSASLQGLFYNVEQVEATVGFDVDGVLLLELAVPGAIGSNSVRREFRILAREYLRDSGMECVVGQGPGPRPDRLLC